MRNIADRVCARMRVRTWGRDAGAVYFLRFFFLRFFLLIFLLMES